MKPKFQLIDEWTALVYKIEPEAIHYKTKERVISEARQLACFLNRKHIINGRFKPTLDELGEHYDRDHTTVSYWIRRIAGLINNQDSVIISNINSVEELLNIFKMHLKTDKLV